MLKLRRVASSNVIDNSENMCIALKEFGFIHANFICCVCLVLSTHFYSLPAMKTSNGHSLVLNNYELITVLYINRKMQINNWKWLTSGKTRSNPLVQLWRHLKTSEFLFYSDAFMKKIYLNFKFSVDFLIDPTGRFYSC